MATPAASRCEEVCLCLRVGCERILGNVSEIIYTPKEGFTFSGMFSLRFSEHFSFQSVASLGQLRSADVPPSFV